MNNFEPVAIKKASHYLGDKLNLFKKDETQIEADKKSKNIYIIENKKESLFRRLGNLFRT